MREGAAESHGAWVGRDKSGVGAYLPSIVTQVALDHSGASALEHTIMERKNRRTLHVVSLIPCLVL
jgi:hypothetical protein